MIRFITQENFSRLDREIEKAYRRRCLDAFAAQGCICLKLVAGEGEALRRSQRARAWMLQLASDVDALENARVTRERRRTGSPAADKRHTGRLRTAKGRKGRR